MQRSITRTLPGNILQTIYLDYDPELRDTLWTWDSDKTPLWYIRSSWVEGFKIPPEDVKALEYNRDNNQDIRIRETCRTLLISIKHPPGKNPVADRLHAQRTRKTPKATATTSATASNTD